jgi:hypothetical protein
MTELSNSAAPIVIAWALLFAVWPVDTAQVLTAFAGLFGLVRPRRDLWED